LCPKKTLGKKLLEAAQITEDRYKSIVGEKPNHLPMVVDKEPPAKVTIK